MNHEEEQIISRFVMPLGETLEIRSSKPIPLDTETEEEIDGVYYFLYLEKDRLPWCTKTQVQAFAIALGCQWGASNALDKAWNTKQRKKDVSGI